MEKIKWICKCKKSLTALLCLVSIFSLFTFAPVFNNLSYAEDNAYTEDSSSDENAEEKSKAPVVVTVIVIFTATAAVTAVLTYKKRLKK